MKALIAAPFRYTTGGIKSHNGASYEVMRDVIRNKTGISYIDIAYENVKNKIDVQSYDEIFIYYGINHSQDNRANAWGGLANQDYTGDKAVLESKAKLTILRDPFPLYYPKSLKAKLNSNDFKKLPKIHQLKVGNINFERMIELTTFPFEKHFIPGSKVIVGDSHTTSLYRPGWYPYYNNRKTLHGALKIGLKEYINEMIPYAKNKTITHADFYFGNIDIRFHVCRLNDGNYEENLKILVEEYVRQVNDLPIENKAIYELLPIESEDRKMAKTSLYNGHSFIGSREKRDKARLFFKQLMKEAVVGTNIQFVEWVDYLMNDKGELDFKCMEQTRGVHLARASYPYWNGTTTINSLFI